MKFVRRLAHSHYGESWYDGDKLVASSFINPGGVYIDDSMGRGAETPINLGERAERFWLYDSQEPRECSKEEYLLFIKL